MSVKGAYPWAEKEALYRTFTDAELEFARKDARETAEIWRGISGPDEGWYMDDACTIASEINRRAARRERRRNRSAAPPAEAVAIA